MNLIADLKIYACLSTTACVLALLLLFSRPPGGRHRKDKEAPEGHAEDTHA